MLADQKKTVFDEDLIAIVDEQTRAEEFARYTLDSLAINIGKDQRPAATVRLRTSDNIYLEGSGSGDGGLDAAFSVIKKLTHTEDTVLQDYRVGAVTMGTDAQGSANVVLKRDGRNVIGRGTDTDVIRASVKAFIDAVNKFSLELVEKRQAV